MTTPVPGTPPPGGRSYTQMVELSTVQPPAQANPDMWANAEFARGGFIGNILSGFLSIGAAIGQALEDLANALFGNYDGSHPGLVTISDGMTELNGRLDLMTDVSGYGGMIMSQTRRFASADFKVIPFDTPYGPSTTSVNVDTVNSRIYLARGTWSVSVLLAVPQAAGVFGGDTHFRAAVTVYRPNGTEYLNQWLDWRSGERAHSFFAQVPLVVPNDDGYYVCIRFTQSSLSFRLLGGTDRTKFWVNRWDLRTDDNNLIINPPDGPDVT